jgi:hypothetical protein
VSLVLFVFTLYLDPTIASVPCFVCLLSVSWAYYCQCPLFCLSSLCILSLLLPVSLVLFVFTLYLEPTIASVPCFVCLHSVSWSYYCQCPLFCLSSLCILSLLLPVFLVFQDTEWRQTKLGTLAIVSSRYRVKTNKTRNTGNSRIKIQSEDSIACVPSFVCLHSVSWSYYCQCPLFRLSSLCILSLLLPVFLVLFVFTLYRDPTIADVPCFVCLHSVSWDYYCQCPLFCLSSLCILIILLPVSLVLFVFPLYLELTIASVPCFVCLHSVSWAYYCQRSLFCLSSLCILSLLLPASLVLFFFTLYLDPTISGVPFNSKLKIQSEDKQNKELRQ